MVSYYSLYPTKRVLVEHFSVQSVCMFGNFVQSLTLTTRVMLCCDCVNKSQCTALSIEPIKVTLLINKKL